MERSEAIEIVRKNWPDGRHQLSEALETLIPELKESEDERIRKELIGFIQEEIDSINRLVSGDYDDRDADDIAHQNWCKKALAWLEKQGSQNLANSEKTCKVEQNPAWSEEDEKMIEFWNLYYEHKVGNMPNKDVVESLEKFRDWLKSLKERHAWKPSDKQMETLQFAHNRIVIMHDSQAENDASIIRSLIDDLKKLKG